jgi:hypothetical protein
VGILRSRGRNNPAWRGGRSNEPYSLEFNEAKKAHIRKIDNYTCLGCGMTEEEHLIVLGMVLHVHHVDYNKMNCNDDNLVTMPWRRKPRTSVRG